MPYVLIVLLALTTVAAVVTRPDAKVVMPPETLSQRIQEACNPPLKLNDWWLDPADGGLVRVSCYDPQGGALTYTSVER